MQERECPDDAAVVRIIGSHPKLGKTWWEVVVFRHLRQVHVYQVTSHGRRYYRSLWYANDARMAQRDLQPSVDDRERTCVSGCWCRSLGVGGCGCRSCFIAKIPRALDVRVILKTQCMRVCVYAYVDLEVILIGS